MKLWQMFSDVVAWRFVVPRRAFFRNIRLARHVPEVKHIVNRQAFLKAAEYFTFALISPLLVVVGVLFLIQWGLARFLTPGRFPIFPPFADWQRNAVEEAWTIVPLDTIRERLGEQEARIVTKKSSQPCPQRTAP